MTVNITKLINWTEARSLVVMRLVPSYLCFYTFFYEYVLKACYTRYEFFFWVDCNDKSLVYDVELRKISILGTVWLIVRSDCKSSVGRWINFNKCWVFLIISYIRDSSKSVNSFGYCTQLVRATKTNLKLSFPLLYWFIWRAYSRWWTFTRFKLFLRLVVL